MIKFLARLFVIALFGTFGLAVSNATPAHAWLTNCHSSDSHTVTGDAFGYAWCDNYGAHGGMNQVRVAVSCFYIDGSSSYRFGPWRTGTTNYSSMQCGGAPGTTSTSTWQTR